MNSANWLKWLGYTREFVTPNKLRTHISSLPSMGFGYWGEKFLPWNLMKLNDSVEAGTKLTPTMDPRIRMIFSIHCTIEIHKNFYNMDYSKYPLIMDKEILYIRRSSKGQRATIYHPDLKVPYVTINDVDVNIDPETRRPAPFPDSWKAQFDVPAEIPNVAKKADAMLTSTKPRLNVVKTHVQVSFSETDENMHTNYSEYLKYAYNSFCENMLNHKYSSDVRHLFNGGVKLAEMDFKQESVLGDILSVESWEDADNSDTYHFEVNKGETLCCFVTLQFFSCGKDTSML